MLYFRGRSRSHFLTTTHHHQSLATFEPDDLEAAIQCCKDSITITSLLRKKDHSLFESSIRLAKGSTSASSIKSMTVVQRHAELIWAECTLLKVRIHVGSSCVGGLTDVARQAVLGIIYSGDFIAFLKEALNMRAATAVYKSEPLHRFLAEENI